MKSWRKRVLIVAAVLVAGAVALEIGSSARKPAAGISGTDVDGKSWSLAEHRGKGPVLVNFFSTT
ncbi:MAG TPA: hypothetical protein VFU47_02170 [Armatimonadota bacterium]|nr:hypothetical protein [Armatimonadota bacterium]